MKDFKGFRKYVTSRQLKLFGTNYRSGNTGRTLKADRLIDGIVSGQFENDEEAAWELYRSKPGSKSYLMLKSRINEQLIGLIYLVDNAKFIETKGYTYYLVQINKYLGAGNLLIYYGFVNEGEHLIKECLKIAQKYEMPGFIINSSKMLRSRASFKGTLEEYNEYNKIIAENMGAFRAEIEADDIRDALNLANRKTFSPLDKKKLSIYWKRINLLNKKFKSQVLRINRTRIGARYFESIGDFKNVIRICDEMIDFMNKNRVFYDKARHREFLNNKLEACMLLKDYKTGEVCAEQTMLLHSDYSINSINSFTFCILFCLQSRQYVKGWELFERAVNLEIFKEFPEEHKERWKLFEAYLSFVYPESKRKVKLAKLMNEVPVYSKDKRGINIAIIIAQIIVLLDEGNFDALLDRADSFKVYFKRYVNKQINYRTYYFIKMIETIFRYNFNYKMIKEKAQEYHDHLADKQGFYKGDIEALEFVTYEDLWEHILQRLKKHESAFMHPVKIGKRILVKS